MTYLSSSLAVEGELKIKHTETNKTKYRVVIVDEIIIKLLILNFLLLVDLLYDIDKKSPP